MYILNVKFEVSVSVINYILNALCIYLIACFGLFSLLLLQLNPLSMISHKSFSCLFVPLQVCDSRQNQGKREEKKVKLLPLVLPQAHLKLC